MGCSLFRYFSCLAHIIFSRFLAGPVIRGAGNPGCTKKPTTAFASRGFLSKTDLISTSAYGGVAYDDYQQNNLPNC
jgi:hypothetical protein